MKNKSLKKNLPYFIVIAVLAIALLVVLAWALSENNRANKLGNNPNGNGGPQSVNVDEQLENHGITPLDSSQASNSQNTTDELTFIIEEEKLAHDVYQAMYEKWGARVFSNIKNSEITHQNLVLAVMKSRGLEDPRKNELGKFANQDLQKLYDNLIAQGSKSLKEAYKVGVLVEETDIVDLKRIIAGLDPKDEDVKAVMENLLNGSENHLRAFNRQAS